MANIFYFRVSTSDQSIEAQRGAMEKSLGSIKVDREFTDIGISGAIHAKKRPGFGKLVDYARDGDTVYVNAVDRLGRDAIDVQTTVRDLLADGVCIHVNGLGLIGKGVGELILAVLAQVADMDRNRIRENTSAGRAKAIELLKATGKTQHGKTSLGRPVAQDRETVRKWREANKASLSETADQFGISLATVKRYCRSALSVG